MDVGAIIQSLYGFAIGITLVILIFFKTNGLKITIKRVILTCSIRLIVGVILYALSNLLSNSLSFYLGDVIFGLVLSFVFLRPLPKRLLIFYGLLPFCLWDLFFNLITYYILPVFGSKHILFKDNFIYFFCYFLATVMVFIFLKWLRYDFTRLKINDIETKNKDVLYIANLAMIVYSLVMNTLVFLDSEQNINTFTYRQIVLVFNLIIIMGVIQRLDVYLRVILQEKVTFQQELQLKDMEKYSNHVEGLYREIRGFRHDYSNLLTTLHLGIEDNDMAQIKEIYESVLQDSSKQLKNHKYDIGRLVNIKDTALKSLLAAKCLEASEKNISVTVEVPDAISLESMTMVDFITIVSILFDNAVEASTLTECPSIRLAFFALNGKQLFVLENATKEESLVISKLYEFGNSSKGKDRGVGLYNVMKLLERYPNASLNTTSKDYTFCQVLEINLSIFKI